MLTSQFADKETAVEDWNDLLNITQLFRGKTRTRLRSSNSQYICFLHNKMLEVASKSCVYLCVCVCVCDENMEEDWQPW